VGGLTTGQEIGEWVHGLRDVLAESIEKKDWDLVVDSHTPGDIQETGPAWLGKYGAFLDFLSGHFSEQFPIGQSILRGPLDMAAAVFGEERMIYLFFDHPSVMKTFLDVATSIFLRFVTIQHERTPLFYQGSVIGSYYLWTPGTCLRLQEDAMALLSPTLYREFVHPMDCAIGSAADYSLFHLHSSGLHLLDILLENEGIDIIQVSKDEGVALEPIIPSLLKVQDSGKCLLLKGRLNRMDLQILSENLDFRGLCIQAVVLSQHEADDLNAVFP
jgi:hypothetical protein